MDLEGQKFVDIAKAVGVAESTVRKYVHRLRSERRESRNIQAGHVLDQLDELKRQNWRLARLAEDEAWQQAGSVADLFPAQPLPINRDAEFAVDTSSSASRQFSATSRYSRRKKKQPVAMYIGAGILGLLFCLCMVGAFLSPQVDPGTSSSTYATKWYSGGTLHNKSALEWQTASPQDKLATCADLVTTMWQNGDLKPSIANNLSTVDDVRPYAQELVDFLDTAFKPDPDLEQNRKMFTNQTVSYFAATGMVTMGWTK